MKEWQHGIDLDVLLAIESLYEKYNTYTDSPFKQIKKNNIAEALHNGDLKVLYRNGAPVSSHFSHRAKVCSPIYMCGDTLIGEKIKNDLTLSCFAGEKQWHLERLRDYKFDNAWLQVWAEDKEANDLAIEAGFTYVFGKITTFGEIISMYFRDSVNTFYKREHPYIHPAEKKNIFKLADVPSQYIQSIRSKIENMDIRYVIHYSKYNQKDSWSAISLRGYSDDPGFIENKGLGLSAPQIGKPYRVFVIGYDNSNKQVFFNPEIIYTSEEEEDHLEGCLSFPRLFFKVSRPKQIKVKYQHISGEWRENEYHGLTARCILHENDHLNGICFIERVGKTTLMMAREKERKLRIKMTRGDRNK